MAYWMPYAQIEFLSSILRCAKCNKRGVKLLMETDLASDGHRFVASCHGATEEVFVTRPFMEALLANPSSVQAICFNSPVLPAPAKALPDAQHP